MKGRSTPGLTRKRGVWRGIAPVTAFVMFGAVLQGTAAMAATPGSGRPAVTQADKPVAVHGVAVRPRKATGVAHLPKAPVVTWPRAGHATATVPGTAGGRAALTGMPVALRAATAAPRAAHASGAGKPAAHASVKNSVTASGAPVRASVSLASHADAVRAGVDGLLLSVRRADAGTSAAPTGLEVDYGTVAKAFGGDYGARLHLVRLPACALTTPGKTACRTRTPIPATNDSEHQSLTANAVTLPAARSATVVAMTSGASSDHGDYTASKLSASSTWSTDLNSGNFSWSYPMAVPPVPGGLEPNVGLSYSSGDIDGRTNTTNNQSSWAGDGFDLWPGFIERSYKNCSDDGVTVNGNKPGDLCWGYDNATLSLNGHSGTLVPAGNDTWKLKHDDGTRIEHLNGSANGAGDNGDNDKEYWRVTTTDGTQYYFGYDKLPGWSSGKTETNSTWNVPVYGNDTGEPCHASTFAASWCQQAWRWNLDYVVDTHSDAIAYYYDKETNSYGRALTASDDTPYDRGGTLDHIDYGLRSSNIYGTNAAQAQVSFATAERCIPQTGVVTCDPSTIDDKSTYWYDTPWDQNCKAGTDCTNQFSPTFWTRRRLTGVTTSVLNSSGAYMPVDSWALTQDWGMSDIVYQLRLDSIQHTGKAPATGSAITLPPVTFAYTQRPNRLDQSGDGTAPFIMDRLSTVDDESGGQTDVNYSTPACDTAHLPTPETNTTRCFPQYYTKSGDENPSLQWFNKYVVDSVTQTDRTTHAPDMVTKYFYPEDAAWHYDDDDGLTKEKYKTWSQWRGYGHVEEETGGQSGMDSRTDHYYLRGMDGDRLNTSGGTKSVTVSDQEGTTLTDHPAYDGFEYRTETYSDATVTGKILGKTVKHPWSQQTATETHTWGTVTADLTGTASTDTYTSLDNGAGSSWRQSTVDNTYDSHGRVTQTDDYGQIGVANDNRCTRTAYADNTTANILDLPSRVETVSVDCSTTPDRSKQVISDVRTAYDGSDYTAAPTKGEPWYNATLKSNDGTTATYLESGTTYDTYGRATATTDLTADLTAGASGTVTRTARTDGLTTTTTYSPSSGIPGSKKVVTPPAVTGSSATAQTTTTALDPYRGLTLSVTDTNSKRTDFSYDTLGRTLAIWLPDRSKAGGQTGDYQYSYTMATATTPVVVGTRTLKNDGTQETSYTILDGLLRPRQVQDPGPGGGRLLTDTFYDERGLTAKTYATYYATGAPATTLLEPEDATGVDTQYWHTYDGLGRETKLQAVGGDGSGGPVLSTTTTTYGGDRVTVIPPTGGVPTTTFTDVRGQTTALWQYKGSDATAPHDTTTYTYTPAGQPETVTDPAGSVWSYTYDQMNRQHTATDPDRGTTTSTYDDRGRLLTTKDARNNVLATTYDNLGRKTGLYSDSTSGAKLADWTYDGVTGAQGQLSASTRYDNGHAYTETINLYDSMYRVNRETTTIPSNEGHLAGSYQSNTHYNLDGTVQSTGYPAAGALPAEAAVNTYDANHQLTQVTGSTSYLTAMTYSLTGKPEQYTLGVTGGQHTYLTQGYEDGTQRLSTSRVDRDGVAGVDRSETYGYDQAGNVRSIADVSRDGTDQQCFTYDTLARLTDAWAQGTTGCAASPSAAATGGPAPYWQTYGYDASGDRTTETDHGASTATDVTQTYHYPPATSAQPHGVTQVDSSVTPTAPASYAYDADGETISRPSGTGVQQTLLWDAEGHLTSVSQPNGSSGTDTTSYLYDADGNRLIQRTPTATTLYTGGQEITLATGSTTPTATRYYDLGGGIQAVRTNDNTVTFTLPDAQGTGQLAVNATTLILQERRTTPYGATRGGPPTLWPGDKGFVGGTSDPTGLTHLGAREYDQSTGRFISVDPLIDTSDPKSLNGYAYTDDSPVTGSDPTGQTPHILDGDGNDRGLATAGGPVLFDNPPGDSGDDTGSGDGSGTVKPISLNTLFASPFFAPAFVPFDYSRFARPSCDCGIIDTRATGKSWNDPHNLFAYWLLGFSSYGAETIHYHGGDSLTQELAKDDYLNGIRSQLISDARHTGTGWTIIQRRDKNPAPSLPCLGSACLGNIVGAAKDLAGLLTHGSVGTGNYAEAIIGSYNGEASISGINRKNGTVRLNFTIRNTSDWKSAGLKFIPNSFNKQFDETLRDSYAVGAPVKETFQWTEQWNYTVDNDYAMSLP